VVKYVEAMVGAKIGQDGTLYRGGTPVHYVNGRMHDPGALGGLRGDTVVDHLREEGLLYRHDTGEGLILHCLGALSECGYLELTSIAASETAAATCADMLGWYTGLIMILLCAWSAELTVRMNDSRSGRARRCRPPQPSKRVPHGGS
jgi:hypothetical protein